MRSRPPANGEIADVLRRIASLLETQHASPFRVRAYRNAARTIDACPGSLADVHGQDGADGLDRVSGVGPRVSSLIRELLLTGRSSLLERLEGQVSPEDLFTMLPGVGDALAQRIHRELDVDTLEELELAAHDGRLERLTGVGERRAQLIREMLRNMLDRSVRRRARCLRWFEQQGHSLSDLRPPVATLLEVDDEYRRRSIAGTLHRITPKRFNPERIAWLPVYHTEKGAWSFTAMYSNTARAHRLQRSGDWVVIFYERQGNESQCTVVTERTRLLAGRRTVRGRETECLTHYGLGASEKVS